MASSSSDGESQQAVLEQLKKEYIQSALDSRRDQAILEHAEKNAIYHEVSSARETEGGHHLSLAELLTEHALARHTAALEGCGATLAELGHLALQTRAASYSRAAQLMRRLQDAGVATLGDRVRLVNALGAAAVADRIPALLRVAVKTGMQPLPRGKGGFSGDIAAVYSKMVAQFQKSRPGERFVSAQGLMNYVATILVHSCAPPQPLVPPPLPRAPTGVGPRLALFVASHCANARRVELLRRCLLSARGQCGVPAGGSSGGPGGGPLAAVFLSWSAEPELCDAVRCAIASAALPANLLHAHEQPRRLTQFQHFAALVTAARPVLGRDGADEAETWVMFSDDDDLMHPARCAAYLAAIQQVPDDAHAVGASWVARPLHAAPGVQTAADVQALLRSGGAVRTPKEGSEAAGGGGSWDEFWNTCMRMATLERFFESACPPALQRSKYADLGCYFFIRHSVPTYRFEPHTSGFASCWCHFYDKPIHSGAGDERGSAVERGAASAGVHSEEADEACAAQIRKVLRQTLELAEAQPRAALSVEQREGTAALTSDVRATLEADARPAGGGGGGGGGRAPSPSPLLVLASQLRSVLEMYATQFVGAPAFPEESAFFALADACLAEQLEALGHPRTVVAICRLHLVPTQLRELGRSFGLPLASAP